MKVHFKKILHIDKPDMNAQQVSDSLGKKLQFILERDRLIGDAPQIKQDIQQAVSTSSANACEASKEGWGMKWMIALVLLIAVIGLSYYLLNY